jgi:hypothetical protein
VCLLGLQDELASMWLSRTTPVLASCRPECMEGIYFAGILSTSQVSPQNNELLPQTSFHIDLSSDEAQADQIGA